MSNGAYPSVVVDGDCMDTIGGYFLEVNGSYTLSSAAEAFIEKEHSLVTVC